MTRINCCWSTCKYNQYRICTKTEINLEAKLVKRNGEFDEDFYCKSWIMEVDNESMRGNG